MTNEQMIEAREFCAGHNVELSFLHSLCESGLLQVTTVEESVFISHDQLPGLEKLVRFHYDMDINLEGIEAIHHLLGQMKVMQDKLLALQNRLSLYEQVDR